MASVREPYNYLQAKQLGCHIITIPPSIIEKIENLENIRSTHQRNCNSFLNDSKKSNFTI